MELKIQEFLLEHKDNYYDILTKDPYNLKITYDGDFFIAKYNQLTSDFHLDIVKEARGIIFNKNTFEVVCWPFKKFFNYGESYADKINWNDFTVTEKIDGSLIKVWEYEGEWHVSTNGSINAKKTDINGIGYKNFYEMFEVAVLKQYESVEDFFKILPTKTTHMFELISPANRIVIPYEETKLYYLGSRLHGTGEECKFDFIDFDRPQSFKFNSLEEIVDKAAGFDWTKEGFVVFDKVNRLKVKSPAYITAHYHRNNGVLTWKHLIKIVMANEQEEFLTYCPDCKEKIDALVFMMNVSTEVLLENQERLLRAEGKYELPKKDFVVEVNKLSTPSWAKTWFLKRYDDREFEFKDFTKYWSADKWCKVLCLE